MTREQAIKIIQELWRYKETDKYTEVEIRQALVMAIKALEQEPTTKIEESNFSQEQYLADMQSAYDCGKSVIDKIRAEIKDWQTDIHDNEYDADKYDFVFERIFEIIDEYKRKSEGQENDQQRKIRKRH